MFFIGMSKWHQNQFHSISIQIIDEAYVAAALGRRRLEKKREAKSIIYPKDISCFVHVRVS